MASDLVLLIELLHIYGKPNSPLRNEMKFDGVIKELKLHPHFNEEVDFMIRWLKL